MALTDFGAGSKCCQSLVVNSQKMKNEPFLGCVSRINHSSIQKSWNRYSTFLTADVQAEYILNGHKNQDISRLSLFAFSNFFRTLYKNGVVFWSCIWFFSIVSFPTYKRWGLFYCDAFFMLTFNFQEEQRFVTVWNLDLICWRVLWRGMVEGINWF